jgi:uncharacterized protein YecT (DUF1311 family)
MRNLILAILLFLGTAGHALAQVIVTDTALVRNTGRFHFDIHYPQTGIPAVDKLLNRNSWSKVIAADLEGATTERPYKAEVSYKVTRNDPAMFSVDISANVYTGGAHGEPHFDSYSFLAPDYQRVYLSELVDGPRGMQKVSQLTAADILRQYRQSKTPITQDVTDNIKNTTAPEYLEGIAFEWQPDALVLQYGPYEFNGYTGNPTIRIPITALADVIRADPRAPSPSFDCGKAHSAIDKAICGNVELARMDRDLSSRYLLAAQNHHYAIDLTERHPMTPLLQKRLDEENARLEKLVAAQRAWLTERNAACASARFSCLLTSYRKRLKESLF